MSRPRSVLRSARRIVGGLAFGLAALSAGLGYWVYRQFASDLPANLSAVTDYQPIRASQIWSADGELIGEFFVEKAGAPAHRANPRPGSQSLCRR